MGDPCPPSVSFKCHVAYLPAAQATQLVAPAAVDAKPAAQSTQPSLEVAPLSLEALPAGQPLQLSRWRTSQEDARGQGWQRRTTKGVGRH